MKVQKERWMMTNEERRAENFEEMAKAGAQFSYQLRNPWTGEKIAACLQAERFTGKSKYLDMMLSLSPAIIDYCGNGGLDTYYMGAPDQYAWDIKRWKRELRKRRYTNGTKVG